MYRAARKSASQFSRQHIFLILLLSGLFIQLIARIHYYGQNVPYWDEWNLHIDIARAASNGTLQLSDLFIQHEAHRTAFTFALVALNTRLLHWDLRLDMYVSAVLELGTFLMLAAYWRQIGGMNIWLVCIAALMFSPRLDWEWSFNTHAHFSVFFIIAMVCGIAASTKSGLIVAMIAAVCATYSSGYGITTLPLGMALLWLNGSSKQRLGIWAAFAGGIGLLYVATFRTGESTSFAPAQIFPFVAAYIGNPFSLNKGQFVPIALIVGCFGLIWATANVRPLVHERKARIWVILLLYALGLGFFIGIGRASLGTVAALTGRYGVFANLFWIAAGALACLNWQQRKLRLLNVITLGILFAVFIWTSQFNYLPTGDDRYICALNWPAKCIYPIYPDPVRLTERVNLLRELRLSLFH